MTAKRSGSKAGTRQAGLWLALALILAGLAWVGTGHSEKMPVSGSGAHRTFKSPGRGGAIRHGVATCGPTEHGRAVRNHTSEGDRTDGDRGGMSADRMADGGMWGDFRQEHGMPAGPGVDVYSLPIIYSMESDEFAARFPEIPPQDLGELKMWFEKQAGAGELSPHDPEYAKRWLKAQISLGDQIRTRYGWAAYAEYVRACAERM